jgi:hypothetical protein
MKTCRERFEHLFPRSPHDNLAFAAFRVGEAQSWPDRPFKVPDGFEIDGDKCIDVRYAKDNDLWLSYCGVKNSGPGCIGSDCVQFRWPIKRIESQPAKDDVTVTLKRMLEELKALYAELNRVLEGV